MGMLVNKKQLSEMFGVTERTFSEYQKDPSFPMVEDNSRGKSNVYDTADVFDWLKHRAIGRGKETAKERLDRLRGDQAELAIAKEVGELVPAELIEQQLTDVAAGIRSAQMFGNTKLKKEIDRVCSTDIDIEILNEHSREILTHLSGLAAEPDGSHEEVAAKTETA